MITYALKTMQRIEEVMEADQGASFRQWEEKVLPHIKDAYQGANEGFRTHLGASVLGKECARQIWYGWRWFKKPKFSARMLRLFNRGHLEEGRLIAMLLAIGCRIVQQDENGRQFRISELGGHLGGSGDGIVYGLPDLLLDVRALVEFKTHGEKSYVKLSKEGVQKSKPEHYVQMQIYMRKMGIQFALYIGVNKNTDDIHCEIVELDTLCADQYLERGRKIIMIQQAPDRLRNASMGYFGCMFCDAKDICLQGAKPEHNCRTCMWSKPLEDGTWVCTSTKRQTKALFGNTTEFKEEEKNMLLNKERQLKGCQEFYEVI